MSLGFNQKITVRFRDVFNEQPQPLKDYLNGISKSRLLNAGAFFLGFKRHNSKYEHYNNLLQMFFSSENLELAQYISGQIRKLELSMGHSPLIINTQGSLKLFEFCFDNLTEEDLQSPKEGEVNIFKAILLINEEVTEKEMLAISSTKEVEQGLKVCAPTLSHSYPYFDLVNYTEDSLFGGQLVKGAFLMEFLKTTPETKLLYETFIEHFQCKNGEEYLARILTLMHSVVVSEKEAHTDIVVAKDELYDFNCAFIEKLSLDDDEILKDLDFRKIRNKPLYKISEGTYRIIFHLFLSDKLYKGIYFKLRELNEGLKDKKIKDLRSVYSDLYSEKFLFYKMIDSIYSKRFRKYTGDEMKANGIDAEPDYYIRNGKHLFLFESKDIFIEAGVKSSYDFKQYEEEFRKKLYFKKDKDKVINKAVLQLVNNVRRALKREFPFDTDYKAKGISIYPILVLYDYQFNVFGLNVMINYWFSLEMEKLKQEGLNIDNVRPIVIIDIDTIIRYQDILRNKKVELEDLIDRYLDKVEFNWKKKRKNEKEAVKDLQLTMIPFSYYLKNIAESEGIADMPKMLLEIGHSLLPKPDEIIKD